MTVSDRAAVLMVISGIVQLVLSFGIVILAICACIFKAMVLVKIVATLAVLLVGIQIAILYAGKRLGENGEIE